MKIHKKLFVVGLLSDVVVANALIDMYSKCGIVQTARELFGGMGILTSKQQHTFLEKHYQCSIPLK